MNPKLGSNWGKGASMRAGRLGILLTFLVLAGCNKEAASPAGPASPGHNAGLGTHDIIRVSAVRPFPEAASVRLFVEEGANGKTVEVGKPNGLLLNAQQRLQYEKTLEVWTAVQLSSDSDFDVRTMCFLPHHFFRYYDRTGRKIGEVAVCFCCHKVEMTPKGRLPLAKNQKFVFHPEKLEPLLKSWGQPTQVGCD